MDIYLFKVKDFTTILVGQIETDESGYKVYYVQRADGTKYAYDGTRVEWFKKLPQLR